MWPFKKEIIYNIKVNKLEKLKKGEIYLFQFPEDTGYGVLLEFKECIKEAFEGKRNPTLFTNAIYKVIKVKGKSKIKRLK